MNDNMVKLIKKNIPEIGYDLSNEIIRCINDKNNINNLEKNTIIHILNTYYCSSNALENFKKYINYSIFVKNKQYDKCLLLMAENLIKNKRNNLINDIQIINFFQSKKEINHNEKETINFIIKNISNKSEHNIFDLLKYK